MKKILELGEHYVSDFISNEDTKERKKYSLDLYLDETIGAARLDNLAPPSDMWGKYWYRSGMNESMTQELKGIAEQVSKRVKYSSEDIWLDIACNDGTMFKFIPDAFKKVGCDPCDDSYHQESSKYAYVIQDYFSYDAWDNSQCKGRQAKVITTIAMFYDLEDPSSFVCDIEKCLSDDGIWHFEQSYMPSMLRTNSYDTICHEHLEFYSLKVVKNILEALKK